LVTFVTISSWTHIWALFLFCWCYLFVFFFYYFTLLLAPLAFNTDLSLESKTRKKNIDDSFSIRLYFSNIKQKKKIFIRNQVQFIKFNRRYLPWRNRRKKKISLIPFWILNEGHITCIFYQTFYWWSSNHCLFSLSEKSN